MTRFAIVVSRWNELITRALLAGAQETLEEAGATVDVHWVPGAWEIPVAVAALLDGPNKPVGVVALGCILQGQTTHAGLLAGDVSSALMGLQVSRKTPIAYGILTPETTEQALERAGLKMGNKGREAAHSALEMVELLAKIGS